MSKKPDYSVPALERGLDVLEVLASQRRPLTLTELAQHSDHTANGLFRITDCLVKRGYLQRDPASGAFRLSLRLFELAHTHSPVDELLRAARQPMEDLVARLGESCHLSLLEAGELVIVAQTLANRRVRLSIEVGSRVPAGQTASGRLLLAHLDDAARDAWTRSQAKDGPVPTAGELGRLRAEGYCAAYEDTVRGVADVAVLVGDPEVGGLAALTVASLSPGNPEAFTKRALPVLRTTALEITKQSGLRGGPDARA